MADMKKAVANCSIFLSLILNNAVAQKDSGFFSNIVLKINPTLISTALFGLGDAGAIIQFPVRGKRNADSIIFKGGIDAFIGAGCNFISDSLNTGGNSGYTFVAGFYFYWNALRNKYISIQVSYRDWNLIDINDVGSTVGDDPQNYILNPLSAVFNIGGGTDPEYLENAKVNIYSFDVVIGKQYPDKRKLGRIFFEWYAGAGLRIKSILYEELGTYHFGQYYPVISPAYNISQTAIVPDLKLGIMIGIIL